MILTTTYRDQTTISRDLLAAFSPLDHATTAALPPEALQGAFERLLRRLTVLSALHGDQTPAAFLTALADPGDVDVVDLAAAFLENGTGDITGAPSEIQQELVHFSRIVDVGHLGLDAGITEHALRRLRGSNQLPDSLKVLSELVVVARSRLIQRGRLVAVPWLRPIPATESDPYVGLTTAAPPTSPDYWMVVRCERRRIRREFRHELSALLEYLTPAEAAGALWAHCHEQQLSVGVDLAVVQVDTRDGVTVGSWSYRPGPRPADGEVVAHVAAQIPTITRLESNETARIEMGEEIYHVRADGPTAVTVTHEASGSIAAVLTAPTSSGEVTLLDLAERARALLATYTGPDLVSMEAGHIHLDRDLDIDQDAGAAIGSALLNLTTARQERPPVLTPMMDDDHVLVRLAPTTYREFLRHTFGDAPMHLICESSPIIRAIVVALYQRMNHSPLANRYQKRGGNLFLPLGNGSHCELFEGIDTDAPVTGCVFFEMALLTYRTDPARFDGYFADRYGLTLGVHEHGALILSSDEPHDAKVTALQDYYATFRDVMDPRRPDPHITGLVNDVLQQAAPMTAHLNVLEDYYEVQQRRVRALLKLLDLPLRVVTVHFNAATGRVVMVDE